MPIVEKVWVLTKKVVSIKIEECFKEEITEEEKKNTKLLNERRYQEGENYAC